MQGAGVDGPVSLCNDDRLRADMFSMPVNIHSLKSKVGYGAPDAHLNFLKINFNNSKADMETVHQLDRCPMHHVITLYRLSGPTSASSV